VKGHVFLLSLDLNGLLKELGFTLIDNLTTIIDLSTSQRSKAQAQKRKRKV